MRQRAKRHGHKGVPEDEEVESEGEYLPGKKLKKRKKKKKKKLMKEYLITDRDMRMA